MDQALVFVVFATQKRLVTDKQVRRLFALMKLEKNRDIAALVKKVVFDELQFFRTNSTSQSGMCVKPKKVLNLMRPVWSVEFLRECG